MELLSAFSSADGKPAIMLIWDFKEKVAAEMKMREVQGDYWKNSVVSVLGVTVYWNDGGVLRSHYIDLVSADTSQDGVWMDAALPVVARELLKMFPNGIAVAVNWSDNGCHFHNSAIFAESLPAFAALLGCGLRWNFFEAGEGKGPCDQHFAVMAHALKEALRSRGAERAGARAGGGQGQDHRRRQAQARGRSRLLLSYPPRCSSRSRREPSHPEPNFGLETMHMLLRRFPAVLVARGLQGGVREAGRRAC
jgi:hypothetical protein